MTTCTKTWTREGFSYSCSLSTHDGPFHRDEKHNEVLMDSKLPSSTEPQIPEVNHAAWLEKTEEE